MDNQGNLACGFETAQCEHDNLFTDRVNPDEGLVQEYNRLLNQAASNQDPLNWPPDSWLIDALPSLLNRQFSGLNPPCSNGNSLAPEKSLGS